MVGAVSARIWTDQVTNKEFQWLGANQNSTTTGNWGLTDFDTDAQTGSANFVITQLDASWINFEITNTGGNAVTLDKLHFAASRSSSTTAPTQITITLEQNGTYANPPVLSASPLTALTVGSANTINLNPSSTAWTGYELSLSTILSDYTLAGGETATFRIANNAGTARIYLDNFAISGSVGGGTPPNNTFASWIGGFDSGWTNRLYGRFRQGRPRQWHRELLRHASRRIHDRCDSRSDEHRSGHLHLYPPDQSKSGQRCHCRLSLVKRSFQLLLQRAKRRRRHDRHLHAGHSVRWHGHGHRHASPEPAPTRSSSISKSPRTEIHPLPFEIFQGPAPAADTTRLNQ